jgi:hypothetical protein
MNYVDVLQLSPLRKVFPNRILQSLGGAIFRSLQVSYEHCRQEKRTTAEKRTKAEKRIAAGSVIRPLVSQRHFCLP